MSSEWTEGIKRAVGLKRTFRRTGSSRLSSIAVGAAVGVVSGYYIFALPLKEHWDEQARLEAIGELPPGTTKAGLAANQRRE